MEEDSKWLAENEFRTEWSRNRFDSLNSAKSLDLNDMMYCSEQDSTTTSIYEDADCGAGGGRVGNSSIGSRSDELATSSQQSYNKSDQHLYSKQFFLIC